ncbi:MAG: type I-E CRISPR-associated protein Cas6/Cse3/CasE [Deltaproteobacteria bacterium]|nr:type I-E CRISPR-associated protein Cas6/Cse3/CasE [Deltaproteobacteria bacterium]
MYLSKVMITGKACRNPYEIHRALWRMFPEDANANRDFLFRVESSGRQQAELLMQSIRQPVTQIPNVRLLATRDYPLELRVGQRVRFLLIANPVKTINDEKGRKNSKGEVKKCRVPLVDEAEQRLWMERKLDGSAQLEALIIDPRLPLYFRKSKANMAGKIQPVSFQGILQIEKPAILKEMIVNGIGPAKSFGCGLLSLARA